jgi:hypothetical protein
MEPTKLNVSELTIKTFRHLTGTPEENDENLLWLAGLWAEFEARTQLENWWHSLPDQ